MTDEEAARAALEAHGFHRLSGTDQWGRDKPEQGALELVESYGEDMVCVSFWPAFDRIPALLAALDEKPTYTSPEIEQALRNILVDMRLASNATELELAISNVLHELKGVRVP